MSDDMPSGEKTSSVAPQRVRQAARATALPEAYEITAAQTTRS